MLHEWVASLQSPLSCWQDAAKHFLLVYSFSSYQSEDDKQSEISFQLLIHELIENFLLCQKIPKLTLTKGSSVPVHVFMGKQTELTLLHYESVNE